MGFHKDLAFGQEGEAAVLASFEKHGWRALCTDGRKEYDFHMVHDDTGATHWVEVKYDRRAKDTGNVFVEYNSRGADSGIRATAADIWVFLVEGEMYSVYLAELITMTEGCRSVSGGDGNSSRGFLVPLERVRSSTLARDAIREGR